jgi:succinate dehydrogenase hydrophobic anchor subunit
MSRARWYLLHLVSGVVIAALLGIHMVVQHLDTILRFLGVESLEPTSWLAVMSRSSSALWVGLYIVLLAFVLYHALYGLKGIILEVTASAKAGRIMNVAFVILGVVVFAWGSYVPIFLLSK